MFFIHPMWDHEAERIGKQKCTPAGYRLHVASDLLGFSGFLLLLGLVIYLVYCAIQGTFSNTQLWWLLLPFLIDFASDLVYGHSWKLADKKSFRYDPHSCRSTWNEDGIKHSYPPQDPTSLSETTP